MSVQAQGIIKRALSQVGYKEGPNNQSKYGSWAGYPDQSWCAAFVSWVFSCERLLPLIAETPHGYINCASFGKWAKAHKLLVPVKSVIAGDILLFCWDDSGVPEHTGIAIGSYDPKSHMIPTVEGNTGGQVLGSQTNGDGVYRRVRPFSCVTYAIRPHYTS